MSAKKDKSVCDYNKFRRPRYFHGMLLDDKDFLDEQGYHAEKRRLLNRMLHGSGVVCGLDLDWKKGAQWIDVTSGFALDCCGNEIWVNKTRRIDLLQLLPPEKMPPDKEKCEEADQGFDLKRYYLGIRYEEKATDPVSVYLPGAGCEERTCEHSRIKEGYCFEIVPCTKKDPPEQNCEQPISCPECGHCNKPCYVILGRIDLDGKGCIETISTDDCREYVITGRLVRHLIETTFAGGVKVPDTGEETDNPIKILCWILCYYKNLPQKPPSATTEEHKELADRVEDQFKEHQKTTASMGNRLGKIEAAIKRVEDQFKEHKGTKEMVSQLRDDLSRVQKQIKEIKPPNE